jgi:ABC-type lipoprotein release transport system permease subunit
VTALATWVRLDLRRRARSLAVLALLVALTTATVMTAVAGARRGSTAVERLLERTLPADIAVLPNDPAFDWGPVADLPEVEALARFPVSAYGVDDQPPYAATDFAYQDAAILRDVERPVVLEGRLPDPERDDEVVVTANFVGGYGKGVGDSVTLQLYTPDQIDEAALGVGFPDPEGPEIAAAIVGVVRSSWFVDSPDLPRGRVIPSVGLFTKHSENLLGRAGVVYSNALVRLEGGPAAAPAFRERLAEVSGRRDIQFFDLAAMADHAIEVSRFEANSLLAFALAAAIAALFLVGQAVTRYAAGSASDLHVLRAFGMPPGQVRVGIAVGPTVAGVVGVLVGAAASMALSSRFPIGTAEPLEPDPGMRVDVLVLMVGLVLTPVLVGGGALLAAWRASVSREGRDGSRLAALARRWGVPVPVLIGTRFALEPGRGSQAVPVRPALLGASIGVLGVVGALTFGAGVSDATANPARFGQVHELEAYLGLNGEDFMPTDEVLDLLAADPDVVAVNDTPQGVAEVGSVDVPVFAIDPVDKALDFVVTEGRVAAGPDEVTLAPASLEALGAAVGDRVELTGTDGDGRFEVTGVAFVPTGSHNEYDEGAWVGRDAYDGLFRGHKFHTALLDLRPGADAAEVAGRLGAALVELTGDPSVVENVAAAAPPSRMAELEEVRRLPLFLAAFLAVLSVGAVGHTLATAVRRRRHDIAVLRALGVTRRQSRWMVVTQATLLASFGLLVGIPLGLALGRTLWRTVADTTPVAYVTPVAALLLALIVPVSLLIANLLAAWPSQRAASIRVGHVLRTE